MNPNENNAETDENPALRTLFTEVFDALVDKSFDGPQAATYAEACTQLLSTLIPNITEVTVIESPWPR